MKKSRNYQYSTGNKIHHDQCMQRSAMNTNFSEGLRHCMNNLNINVEKIVLKQKSEHLQNFLIIFSEFQYGQMILNGQLQKSISQIPKIVSSSKVFKRASQYLKTYYVAKKTVLQ